MITLLHGDNSQASRVELLNLKDHSGNLEIRQLDGKNLDSVTLVQALDSSSLFGGDTLIIIENFLTKLGKKSKTSEALIKTLVSQAAERTVVLWEEKEIGKANVDLLGKNVLVKLFKTPAVIFQFLDSIKPGNTKNMLMLFSQSVTNNAPEVTFTLLTRRFRQLIMLKDNITPEVLADWQRDRLTTQARLFTMDKLVAMYRSLASLDYKIKTGTTAFTLTQLLEQFLLDI